jgi:hypothetical protein
MSVDVLVFAVGGASTCTGKAANAAAAHAPITRELLMPHGSEQKAREEEEEEEGSDTQSEASTTSWHDDRSAVDEEEQQDDPNDDHCAWCQDGAQLHTHQARRAWS